MFDRLRNRRGDELDIGRKRDRRPFKELTGRELLGKTPTRLTCKCLLSGRWQTGRRKMIYFRRM